MEHSEGTAQGDGTSTPLERGSDSEQLGGETTILLACQVMRALIGPRLAEAGVREIYMDYGLHVRPKRMAAALQAELDGLAKPQTVLLGYGLCGNGLAGLKAGHHTLIIPRTDDCIAILLGSFDAYLQAQRENPGTYYLTRGWLESEDEPLSQYLGYVERFGTESADHVIDAMYDQYTVVCFVATNEAELIDCRARAREIADFCAERWGMRYEERVGSAVFIGKLLDAPQNIAAVGDDLLVIPPGGTVETEMFARHLEHPPTKAGV
ncbi:MAG: DUF1638 domain-containing protein [Alphaproteobacteria bacterium]